MEKVDDELAAMYARGREFRTRQVEEKVHCHFCNQELTPDIDENYHFLGNYPCCMNRDCVRDAGIEYELDKQYLADADYTEELTFNEFVVNELLNFKEV